jgi:diguanylate cyclase (GGDEF)-like protein
VPSRAVEPGQGPATAGAPFVDIRVRWRAGQALLVVALVMTAVAWLRPLDPGSPVSLRAGTALALGGLVALSALLSSLRGRGPAELLAFYAFLLLSLDGIGQVLAPLGWPIWPAIVLVVGAAAVAEPWPRALGLAALSSLLFFAAAGPTLDGFRLALAQSLGCLALVVALSRALRGEKQRLAGALSELARLRHGIDQLDEVEPDAGLRPTTADLTLRQISGEGRRSRQAERAVQIDEDLAALVGLCRRATNAHAVLYFDVDRRRDGAFLRAVDGPERVVRDAVVPLSSDPFAFVLDRNQSFYATDFPRLLGALAYYPRDVLVGSLLAVPVRIGDVIHGILVADRLEIQSFTGHEPELLAGFAELAAQMIHRLRESGSREDMGTEFKAVYAVSRNLTRLGEIRPLRRLLVRSARDMVPELGAAALVLCDEARTRYTVEPDASGWPRDFEGREVGLAERTWAAWVLRGAEEPYLLDDIASHQDRMPILVLDEGSSRAESLLALPLRAGDRNLGALVLCGKRGTFDATVLRVLGILANQTAAALATIQLVERNKQLAIRDGLTHLYNRRAFDEALTRAVAQEDRHQGSLSVLLLDLDHFKKLNDTFGHQAGDAALRHTADTLLRHLRKGDLAARYGGEEFVVILPGTERQGAVQLAERVRSALKQSRLVFEGASITMTASIGVAIWPHDGREPAALLGAADRALYQAKEGGRNRVVSASAAPEATASS